MTKIEGTIKLQKGGLNRILSPLTCGLLFPYVQICTLCPLAVFFQGGGSNNYLTATPCGFLKCKLR